jgi:ribosome maturation factor RimP
MDLSDEIKKLTEPALAEDQFIVDVIAASKNGPGKILVIVDGDRGINIDACAEISRKLSKALDDAGLMQHNYLLEVSTPGVEHPLRLKRQYTKHIGRSLKIKLREEIVEGKLVALDGDNVTLSYETGSGKTKETQTRIIPFADIEKAFVLVSFK